MMLLTASTDSAADAIEQAVSSGAGSEAAYRRHMSAGCNSVGTVQMGDARGRSGSKTCKL